VFCKHNVDRTDVISKTLLEMEKVKMKVLVIATHFNSIVTHFANRIM